MELKKTKVLLFGLVMSILIVLSIFGLAYNNSETSQTTVADAAKETTIATGSNAETLSMASVSDLTFTPINGGTEYKVSAKYKTLTDAIIPSTYNDLSVVEIADNGFLGCSALTSIIIPKSVRRVGTNAFMNDVNLTRVVGMAGVKTYGNNAFAMCANLENLILPAGITTLGTSVIKNVNSPVYARATAAEMAGINPNWNYNGNIIHGNQIVYEPYTNADNVTGYQIKPEQLLAPSTEPLTIYSWCYADENDNVGAPLLSIGAYAFQMFEVPSITIMHPENSNLSHSINIDTYAFLMVNAECIDIKVDITLNSETSGTGFSDGLFYYSTIQSVTLPDSIEVLPQYMFGDCVNLTEIKNTNSLVETNHLSDKITDIQNDAFANCYSLPNLHIENTIEYIGGSAFSGWGTGSTVPMQNIYINLIDGNGTSWDGNWAGGVDSTGCNIEFTGATEYSLTLEVLQDGVVNPTGAGSMVVAPGTTINDILPNITTFPTSTSHDFAWVLYTTADRTPGTGFSFDTPIKRNLTLYAGWTIKTFEIPFASKHVELYNAISSEMINGKTLSFEYGENYSFYVLSKAGYTNPVISYGDTVLTPNSGGVYTIQVTNGDLVATDATLIQYNIIYKNLPTGATNPNTRTTFTVETPTIYLSAPQWAAYDGRTWDITSIPTGTTRHMEVTAIWTNLHTFYVYFNLPAGVTHTNQNPRPFNYETSNFTLSNPIKSGYNCWWDISTINKGTYRNITANAIVSAPIEYNVTFNYNGAGVNYNDHLPSKYTIEDSYSWDYPLGMPKVGYRYYWDRYEIKKGTTGDITVNAYSAGVMYSISLEHGAITSSSAIVNNNFGYTSITAIYDKTYTIEKTNLYSNSKYVFYAKRDSDGKSWELGSGTSISISNLSTIDEDYIRITLEEKKCVTPGTLITLADGTPQAVETLDGTEELLVWNLFTGAYDTAPILFIDSDEESEYEIINLHFSDNTTVEVITEHGFYDLTLNKYVMLRADAAQYIGHWYKSENGDVQLVDVELETRLTTAWSPVTYGHLCYFVNGMLSMPGATTGLINIFSVDPDTMMYDQDLMDADIEEYGLFTYDEFYEIFPIPEEIFNAFNGQYLKVSIGKGLITYEELGDLITSYAEFFV